MLEHVPKGGGRHPKVSDLFRVEHPEVLTSSAIKALGLHVESAEQLRQAVDRVGAEPADLRPVPWWSRARRNPPTSMTSSPTAPCRIEVYKPGRRQGVGGGHTMHGSADMRAEVNFRAACRKLSQLACRHHRDHLEQSCFAGEYCFPHFKL